jgi:acyl carrier protein
MSKDQLKEIIFRILKEIAPECDPAELSEDENIREALDIDSYGFLQMLISISEETGVEIPEADYSRVFTLGGMLDYLSRYLA